MASEAESIQAGINFIADLPVYEEEKPFYLHVADAVSDDVDKIKTTNLEWVTRRVPVYSMRDKDHITLDKNGFCYVTHESSYLPTRGMGVDVVTKYRKEGEDFLQAFFNAELVHCYDYKLRKNSSMTLQSYDPEDPLLVEQVPIGAHVDITLDTVPRLLKNIMNEDQLRTFFQPGYRFRLINVWRSVLPVCEDRPLGLCDYSSTEPGDLLATDRVYPTRIQEIYHLKYNKQQRWYWLPKQKSNEPFLFVTYDSSSGGNARYCPHISFKNPLAPSNAPPRESVETRNLVITKL